MLKLADIQISDEEVKDQDIKAAIEKVLEDVPALKSQEPTPKPGITLGADGNPAPKPKGNVSLTDAIANRKRVIKYAINISRSTKERPR